MYVPHGKKLKDVRNFYPRTYSFLKRTALLRSVRIEVESCIIFILIYFLVYRCTLNLFRVVFNYICILSRPSVSFTSSSDKSGRQHATLSKISLINDMLLRQLLNWEHQGSNFNQVSFKGKLADNCNPYLQYFD